MLEMNGIYRFCCGVVADSIGDRLVLQDCVMASYCGDDETHVIYDKGLFWFDLFSEDLITRFKVVNRDTYEELVRCQELRPSITWFSIMTSEEMVTRYKKLGIRLHFFE